MGKEIMKVAIIEPVGGHGGMDYYDYGLAQGLGKNEVEVHYFTSSQTKVLDYTNVYTWLYFKKVWNNQNKIVRLYYFLSGYWKSFKKSKELGVLNIHLQFFDLGFLNVLVMLLASYFNFQKTLTLHDVSSLKSDKNSWLETIILNRFSRIIVHNQLSFDELKIKAPESKIAIIPHGNYLPFIDELEYEPKDDNNLNLLFFGQIKKVKGLEVLLKALRRVVEINPNVHLTIAGKPWHDEIDIYKNLIVSLNLERNVTSDFKYIPNDKVADYFKNTDLVVLPYKKIYQSGVLLLSMSYGRVALTSDLPAFKEIVEHNKTGLIFENENHENLAAVILKVVEKKSQLKIINKNASSLLRSTYDWTLIGSQIKNFYSIKK